MSTTEPKTATSGPPMRVDRVPEPQQRTNPVRSWVVLGITAVVLVGSVVAMFLPLVPEAIGGAAIVLMLALIFLRLPVAVAMMIPALLGMYAMRGFRPIENMFATMPYDQVANWTLSVIPMFVLIGLLLWRAGLTESLYVTGRQWLGWLPGGLGVGTNVAGAGLASVSGSTIGTTYALARVGIPEMLKAGYDKRLAIGSVVVAGLPGQLIPPSIMLVIYAGITEVPIGPQLLAGVLPGVLVAVLFTIMIIIFAQRWAPDGARAAAGPRTTWSERLTGLTKVWPVPLIILVIVYGMFSGVFTATEAGAAAALCALVVSVIWMWGKSPWRAISDAATATAASVGAIFFLLIGVEMLSRMFALTGISTGFADLVESMDLNRVQFLLAMTLVYLVLGTFMESMPMLFLTVPVLMPTLASLDISLLWFGVFAVFMAELAILTPPVGILSFILYQITKEPEINQGHDISLNDVFKSVAFFMPMAVVVILVLIFFPGIATWLPDRAG